MFTFSAGSSPLTNQIDSLSQVLTEKNLTTSQKMLLWEQLGEVHESNYDAPQAAEAYHNAIVLHKAQGIFSKVPALLYKHASMAIYAGDYNNALTSLEEILSGVKQKPDDVLRARTLMQIGVVNFFQQKWDEALYFYRQALAAAEKLKNRQGVSIAYNNIANIYQKKGESATALSYYDKAIAIQRQEKDSASMCNCLMNMGTIYMQQGLQRKGMATLNEALSISQAVGDHEIEALTYMNLARAHAFQNDHGKASEMLYRAEALSEQTGYKQVLHEVLTTGSNLFKQAGDYTKAYSYLARAMALGDSLTNQQLKEKTKELEVRYKTAEREAELQIHARDLRLARIKQIFMLIVVAMLLALTGYLIYSTRSRRRRNRKLVALNATKDKLFSIISHDLKAPAIAQKIAVEALLENLDTIDEKGLREQLKAFHSASETQTELLQNLLHWAQLQTGRLKYRPFHFDISEAIRTVVELYSVPAQNKKIKVVTEMPPEHIVYADKLMISTVIRNLLNNAIKFSHPGGNVHLLVKPNGKGTIVSVSDSGTGMTTQQLGSLFKPLSGRAKEDMKGEKGSGLGLVVSKDLIERNNSHLQIESEAGKGTTIKFYLDNECA